jgi:hypothetical protein
MRYAPETEQKGPAATKLDAGQSADEMRRATFFSPNEAQTLRAPHPRTLAVVPQHNIGSSHAR